VTRAVRAAHAGETPLDPAVVRLLAQRMRQRTTQARVEPLTDRERDVLSLVGRGASNKEIATELGISTKTVETYKARITDKLGLRSRTDMVRFAVKQGWLVE
jgi:DNA-binding NarL/FixJ family response regulator